VAALEQERHRGAPGPLRRIHQHQRTCQDRRGVPLLALHPTRPARFPRAAENPCPNLNASTHSPGKILTAPTDPTRTPAHPTTHGREQRTTRQARSSTRSTPGREPNKPKWAALTDAARVNFKGNPTCISVTRALMHGRPARVKAPHYDAGRGEDYRGDRKARCWTT